MRNATANNNFRQVDGENETKKMKPTNEAVNSLLRPLLAEAKLINPKITSVVISIDDIHEPFVSFYGPEPKPASDYGIETALKNVNSPAVTVAKRIEMLAKEEANLRAELETLQSQQA